MFIKDNSGILVNIDNVTSIMFEGTKVIFNMNYGISLNSNPDKIIPDYVYLYLEDEDEVKEFKDILNSCHWFTLERSDNPNRWVNPKNISFVKYEVRDKGNTIKYRVIVNLASSVSLNNDIYARTSDAVYYDFVDVTDYENAKNFIDYCLGIQ